MHEHPHLVLMTFRQEPSKTFFDDVMIFEADYDIRIEKELKCCHRRMFLSGVLHR